MRRLTFFLAFRRETRGGGVCGGCLQSRGQVGLFMHLIKFIDRKEETKTLIWFNKLYLNFRLELSAHTL